MLDSTILPKLWASVWRICAQLLVWDNLWSQIFHKIKIDARGSIRKEALNVISWTTPLDKLCQAGDIKTRSISSKHGMPSHRNIRRSWGPRLRRSTNELNKCASSGERARLGEMPLGR